MTFGYICIRTTSTPSVCRGLVGPRSQLVVQAPHHHALWTPNLTIDLRKLRDHLAAYHAAIDPARSFPTSRTCLDSRGAIFDDA